MTNNFLKRFLCSITGNDYHQLKMDSLWSRRKVSLLGTTMLIPVIFWIISTFLLLRFVLESSLTSSVIAAVIAGTIIFSIERSIVMAEFEEGRGKWVIGTIRILLGVLVAILGAFVIDVVIFDRDIRLQLNRMQEQEVLLAQQEVDGMYMDQLNRLRKIVDENYNAWQKALEDVKLEAEGTSGSGLRGVHSITRLKMDIARQKEQEYYRSMNDLEKMNELVEVKKAEVAQIVRERFEDAGLLVRSEALFNLLFQDLKVSMVYLIFLLLMVFCELIPVMLKIYLPQSSYEYQMKIQDQVKRRQLMATHENFPFPHNLNSGNGHHRSHHVTNGRGRSW